MSETAEILSTTACWYLNQQGQTFGPYTREQVVALILGRRVDRQALLQCEGWPDWRPLTNCLDELSDDAASRKAREARTAERRVAAPRVVLNAEVVAKSTSSELRLKAADISITGIFVVQSRPIYRIGEQLSIAVTSPDLREGFATTVEVARYNANSKFAVGYGLRFLQLDNKIVGDIARLVGVRPISEFGVIYSGVANAPNAVPTAATGDTKAK